MYETITNFCSEKSKNPLSYFENLDIRHPNLSDKAPTSIGFKEFWEGLLDQTQKWNILDRISSPGNDYQMTSCPPCPSSLSHTVGNRNLSTEDLKETTKWYERIRGKLVEVDVYHKLRDLLINERGTVFFGYNTNTYLSLFTEIQESGVECLAISDYWENLAFLKGLNINSVGNSADCENLTKYVTKTLAEATQLDDFLQQVSSVQLDGKTKIKHLDKVVNKVACFMEEQMKTDNFRTSAALITEDRLKHAYTKAHIEASGSEKDIFYVFPKRRTLMQIEVKDSKPKKVNVSIRDAIKQIQDMKDWLQKAHGDLFNGWKYVSVIALTQCERNQIGKASAGTKAIFITKDDMHDKLVPWWSKFSETHPEIQDEDEYLKEERKYIEFMKRTIGFISFTNDIRSSLSKHHEKICEDLIGNKFMTAGASSNDLVAQETHSLSENLNKVDETKRRFIRAIFWSPQQKQLVEKKVLKLLFHSDFGTGKTLIFKATAREIAKDEDEEVIFITMPRLFYYEGIVTAHQLKLTVFELATIQEFKGTNIKFISDTFWMTEGEDIRNAQKKFMEFAKGHLNTHIFVDEYRSLNQAHIENHMEFMKFICTHHTGYWWLAVRLSPLDTSNAAELPILHYKNLNIELGLLQINLRCTGKIMEAGNKVREELNKYKLRPPNTAAAPLETLPGSPPQWITVKNVEDLADKVKIEVKKFNGEPLVVIVDHPEKRKIKPFSDFPDIIENALGADIKCTRYILNEFNDVKKTNAFLKEPEGVLLTDIEMFTGMECKNIIYVCGKEKDVDALLRSVSILTCIQYEEDSDNETIQN